MLDPDPIRRRLARYPCRKLPVGSQREAAVLVPLCDRQGEMSILFTRRTEHLPHHRGEISFPGGGRHSEDVDLLATALRETEEELGLPAASVSIVGRLDDFFSVHNYHVVPFVGIFPWPSPLHPNAYEIAEVILLPLTAFADPACYRQEDWRHRGRTLPIDFFTVGGYTIWGLSAGILRQLLLRLGLLPVSEAACASRPEEYN